MGDDIHRIVDDQLRRTRQRYTRGRRQLIDALAQAASPVTIAELGHAGVDQALSSLYRNLAILEQCGAVRRITSSDEVTRFELAEELSEHHHHLVCESCGRLEDMTLSVDVERALAGAADTARHSHDFAVATHHLELVGLCASCR